jgi:hypothetical protein
MLPRFKIRVIRYISLQLFVVWIYAITIRLFVNIPLQFDVGLNRVILYIFDSL